MPADLVLNYPTRSTGRASLEEFDGGVRLTFPVTALWIRVVSIVSCCLLSTVQTLNAVIFIGLWWHFRRFVTAGGRVLPTPGNNDLLEVVFPLVLAVGYWFGCFYVIKDIQKKSRNPETWTATQNELTIWRYSIFGLRRRVYLATDVKSVETSHVADFLRRKNMVDLTVRFKNGRWRVMRRISAKNSALAVRAAAAFRKTLNLREETK